MQFNIVYSIGIRCYTELILKRLNLIKFSSIFGSINIKNTNNFIQCIQNIDLLFDESQHVYTKDIQCMNRYNKKHGFRTIHRKFDDINDYHSSTIAHHDLSDIKNKNHFKRGIERLNVIKKNNIPILFVQISHETEFNNSIRNDKLTENIINAGFNNMTVLSIYLFTGNLINEEIQFYENHIYCSIKIESSYDSNLVDDKISKVLDKLFNLSNLITKEELDNLL